MRNSQAATSRSRSSTDDYGVTHSHTLSFYHSITQATTYAFYFTTQDSSFSLTKLCPSIYTYTTLWLFTHMAHMGHTFKLFTSIVPRVGYIHDFSFGLGRSSSTRLFSSHPEEPVS